MITRRRKPSVIIFESNPKRILPLLPQPHALSERPAQRRSPLDGGAGKTGRCLGVVTQNIDNLHTLAGSQHVAELHGSIMRNYCVNCHHEEGLDFILKTEDLPRGPVCGGLMKPDVVLYEEALDEAVMDRALTWIQQSDVLIICGTSLSVYPAASMVRYFYGDQLVVINKTATSMDKNADLNILAPLAETLAQLHV